MPPVFNRYCSGAHAYDSALAEWLKSDLEYAAMARNVQWDHRVSTEREREFNAYILNPCDGKHLRKAIEMYFDKEIRTMRIPAFFDEKVNGQNIIHGGSLNKNAFDEDLRLVTMLDLNRLGKEFQKAKIAGWSEFIDFPTTGDDQERLDWLDSKLQGKSDFQQQEFIARVLERLRESRRSEPFQPVWVTFWDWFEPFFNEGADRWCEIVGVPKVADAVWIVVLCYTVSEAGTLVRPTQLDAGWFVCHFPSPEPRPLFDGGCPIDLKPINHSTALIPEFFHQQIDFSPNHIRKVGRTSYRTAGGSFQSRLRHRQTLKHYYVGLDTWMPNPL